jgi:hypothetical protein
MAVHRSGTASDQRRGFRARTPQYAGQHELVCSHLAGSVPRGTALHDSGVNRIERRADALRSDQSRPDRSSTEGECSSSLLRETLGVENAYLLSLATLVGQVTQTMRFIHVRMNCPPVPLSARSERAPGSGRARRRRRSRATTA